jgi:hypothetical protein
VERSCAGALAINGLEFMITGFQRGRGFRGSLIVLAALGSVTLCGCGGKAAREPKGAPTASIGVNAYLWRATLDTLSFMPLQSADPFGGVVNTEWYINPQRPTERFKITVYILDSRLRADGLSVNVFKEVSNGQGGWAPSPAAEQTASDIENSILTKARQLRLSNLKS